MLLARQERLGRRVASGAPREVEASRRRRVVKAAEENTIEAG